jgi:hypothetical protein
MKKIIHVHQNNIRHNINAEPDEMKPPIIVRTYKGSKHYNEIEIKDGCKVIYSPKKPLSCGARLWIETEGEVVPVS